MSLRKIARNNNQLSMFECTTQTLSNHKDLFPVVGEIKLSYKTTTKPTERPQVRSSQDGAKYFRETWNYDTIELQEEFKVMFVNRAQRILGIYPLSRGAIAGTVADPRLIIAAAILTASTGILLCHNHPSGNLKPSQADITLTKKVKEAAKLHEIDVLDHVIITATSHYSFADDGIL